MFNSFTVSLIHSVRHGAFVLMVRSQQSFVIPARLRLRRASAFTMVELLAVLAIISLLTALLFPVFLTVRGQARKAVCLSNLRQIGMSVSMYAQDYDGLYPFAVDPVDRAAPGSWGTFPAFEAVVPTTSMIHEALQSYVKSKNIFRCPADSGFDISDLSSVRLDARPSSYEKFGTSYYYRTEIAARGAGESTFQYPEAVNVLFDGAGHWHGSLFPLALRYNVLFADGHTKNVTRVQLDEAWASPLSTG